MYSDSSPDVDVVAGWLWRFRADCANEDLLAAVEVGAVVVVAVEFLAEFFVERFDGERWESAIVRVGV